MPPPPTIFFKPIVLEKMSALYPRFDSMMKEAALLLIRK
jgi:hypothetical protein